MGTRVNFRTADEFSEFHEKRAAESGNTLTDYIKLAMNDRALVLRKKRMVRFDLKSLPVVVAKSLGNHEHEQDIKSAS